LSARLNLSAPPPVRPAQSDRFFLSALGVAQICSWGSLYYSFPVIAEAMGADLGWSKPELYGAATLGLALSGLAAYPVGAAVDKGHGRAVMGGASILAGLLLLAWSQIADLVLFYLIFAGIGCLHAATLYEPAFAVVARRFGARQTRRGITALTLWGGFASTVFIPLVQVLIDYTGWRGALIALGLINIGLCSTLYFTAIRPDRDRHPLPAPPTEAAPASSRSALSSAAHTTVFWALALTFIAYAATYSAFTFHLYPMLIEKGLSVTSTVGVLTVIGPAQVAGRIIVWMLASNRSIRTIGSAIVVVFPVAFGGVALLPPVFLTMAAMAALYGAANGVMTIVRGLAVPEMISRDAYGAINGALIGPSFIARAIAPAGAAALWAASQSYDLVIGAIVLGAVITACSFWAAALSARRKDHQGDNGL
jgi:predicted MFS family arabinose efflux permease